MEYENRMEQHYAVSKSGVLVYINEAHDSKEDCFCPQWGCLPEKHGGVVVRSQDEVLAVVMKEGDWREKKKTNPDH